MLETDTFIRRVKARQLRLEEVRKPAEAQLTELIDLLLPSSTPFVSSGEEGEETGTELYLSDPVRYLRTCADGVMGAMVSPHFRWFGYAMANRLLRGDDQVNQWLQECEEHMYYMFRSKSNLYSVNPPHFRYALGLGNSVLLRYEDIKSGRHVFTCPHPRESYWLEDYLGRALPYHRLYTKTVADIVVKFDKSKMSKAFNKAVDEHRDYEEFRLLHCIYAADDPIFNGTDIKTNRPYMEFYLEYDAPEIEVPKPIRQAGYFTNPVNPWRLEKSDDEVYGRGIGHLALPDIRGANELRAAVITGIHKEVDPPILATGGLRGRIKKNPGGETYIDRGEYEAAPNLPRELLTRPVNYAAIRDFEERAALALREWFSVDYFLQLSNLAQQGAPPTATQILGMADEKAILLIGRVGRFDSDCFDNLMKSVFYTEYAAGRLPPPPQIVLDAGGDLPEVEYLGPLAQAQRRMHSVRNTLNALGSVAPVFEAFPKAVHKIRGPEFVEYVLEESGFPQKLIVPKAEYDQLVAAMAQQEQQLAQAEMMSKMAKAVPSLGKKVDPTSPMAKAEKGEV